MKLTYLLINFFSVLVPLLFSFHRKIRFNEKFKVFAKGNLIVSVIFLVWDAYFTSIGIWSFNPKYLLGIEVLNLPLEEVLFFICIPFSCLFTYYTLETYIRIKWEHNFERNLIVSVSLIMFVTGVVYFEKAYTASTFISTALVLLMLKFYFKVDWLSQFFCIYCILLIPFFIVNGVLTGSGLEQPVVIYNNNENLGVRLMTIPFEDIFYGMELMLLNIFLFKYFEKQQITSAQIKKVRLAKQPLKKFQRITQVKLIQ